MIGELTLLLMIIMIFYGGFVLLVEKTDVFGENHQHATKKCTNVITQIRLV
jgi:hypothetical protein